MSIRSSREGWQSLLLHNSPRGGFTTGALMFLGPPVPQGSCCSCLQIRALGCGSALEHMGAFCWALRDQGGNQERSQPGWSCSLRGGTCGLPELFLTSLYIWLCHNLGMKPSRGVPHAPIPFAMPESFPSQNRVTCPVQADQDMTLMLNLAAKGRSGLLS